MRTFFFLFFIFALSSCKESFEPVDPSLFNAEIRGRTDIASPEELIKLFYGSGPGEGTRSFTVEAKETGAGVFEIMLVHEGLADDSVDSEKILMEARKENGKWTVLGIRRAWKCKPGRGRASWGTEACS